MVQKYENTKYRHGFVAESDDETTVNLYQGSDENNLPSESETEQEALKIFKKKRPDKKSSRHMDVTDDLIDVVCSNEYFSKKLIFTNTKTSKNGEIHLKVIKEVRKHCQDTSFVLKTAQTQVPRAFVDTSANQRKSRAESFSSTSINMCLGTAMDLVPSINMCLGSAKDLVPSRSNKHFLQIREGSMLNTSSQPVFSVHNS